MWPPKRIAIAALAAATILVAGVALRGGDDATGPSGGDVPHDAWSSSSNPWVAATTCVRIGNVTRRDSPPGNPKR